jgi:hypothetical protein
MIPFGGAIDAKAAKHCIRIPLRFDTLACAIADALQRLF